MRNLSTQKGFSLIGVIIAAAIGIIIATALILQIISSGRQVHYLEAKIESINMKQELILLMNSNNGASCNTTFGGMSVNLANSSSGDFTDITSSISGTPLQALVNSYTNNRYIEVTTVKLFKPYLKMDGVTPNNSSPYEFNLKLTANEKSAYGGMTFNVDGPTIILNVATPPIVDSPDACISGVFSNVVRVTASSGTCASGCAESITATCPAGRKLLTGSCSGYGGGPANTFIFEDQASGNGWYCLLWNNSAAANGVRATAVCY